MLKWDASAAAGETAPAAHPAGQQGDSQRERDIRHVNRAVSWVLGFSALVLLLVGWRAGAVGPVFLWALACLAGGGAVGFLFGIPRVTVAKGDTAATAPPAQAGVSDAGAPPPGAKTGGGSGGGLRANTNLEEVSDWLTKIIVGLGLVHLTELQDIVADMAANAAAALVDKPTATHVSLGTALIVGFAIQGFFLGYLYTRMFLQGAFARSDDDLQVSSRTAMQALVDQAPVDKLLPPPRDGQPDAPAEASLPSVQQQALAEQVLQLAKSDPAAPVEKMQALARDYERIRASMESGAERTQKMNDVVGRMTLLALGAEGQIERLASSSQPGDRLAAVVILKLRVQARYTTWLAERLTDDAPFIGFHAASALLAASRLLGGADLETLLAAVAKARDTLQAKGWLNDPPRDSLIAQVLARSRTAAAASSAS